MPQVSCMVLIPAGPDTVRANLEDTVDSINHYIGVDACRVAIVDDSRRDAFRDLADTFPNILIVTAPNFGEGLRSRKGGPLLAKELSALRTLLESWRFDLLLKMDTDALVIGERPQFEVRAAFEQDHEVGMIGAFRRRGDGTDKQQAMYEKGLKLTREMSLPAGLRHPALMVTLRRLVTRAERHGYHRGDTCTGGAYFMSWRAVDAMRAAGHLDLALLRHSRLPEDTLMALLCGAAGYRLADMPPERDSLAINWRGLPMPLEALVSANKKIVHPVKTDDPATEEEVRAYFRRRRTSGAGGRGSSPGLTPG